MSTNSTQRKDSTTITLEIVARMIGALAFLTGLVYLWGLMDPILERDNDVTWQIALIVLGSLSLAVAWRWEMWGGLAAVLSGLVLGGLISASASYSPLISGVVYGSPFFVAGLLFLLDALNHNRQAHLVRH